MTLETAIFLCGIGQLSILIASSLVPFQLNWKEELKGISLLHRQMYWVYGGYVVLSIIAFSLISIFNAKEIAAGTFLARSVCTYITVFWGVRLCLQSIFDVRDYLHKWWLRAGYHTLSALFFLFTICYGYAAFH